MIAVLDDVLTQIGDIDGSAYGLVVDVRNIETNQDPKFDKSFQHFRKKLNNMFARTTVVVETEEGLAQAQSHSPDPTTHAAFRDLDAAKEWAKGPST